MSNLNINAAQLRLGNFQVLDGITFSANKGQFITILGPSGCGKTTLLKVIAGFLALDAGSVLIDGRDVSSVPPEFRNTTMCFQSYALFPHLSVAENIAFGLRQKKVPRPDIKSRVEGIARRVSLSAHLSKLPAQLSGGQQQRVALARALVVQPGVVLFDEPLSNLDAQLRNLVRLEIRQLQRSYGFTAVYVTHDQEEALEMSDQIIVMNAGKIEQMGTPHEIYYSPVNRFVANFIGIANIMVAQVLAQDRSKKQYRVSTALGVFTVESNTPPQGSEVYVFWRPEDAVLVHSLREAPNTVLFTVTSTRFLGNISDLSIKRDTHRNDDTEWRVQLPGQVTQEEGEQVFFSLPPQKLRFLAERVQ
ncbi:ABC transporter ATP-binding protein [Ewingella sp. S1.OA.A_B6]